jgi:hypothetical protein
MGKILHNKNQLFFLHLFKIFDIFCQKSFSRRQKSSLNFVLALHAMRRLCQILFLMIVDRLIDRT